MLSRLNSARILSLQRICKNWRLHYTNVPIPSEIVPFSGETLPFPEGGFIPVKLFVRLQHWGPLFPPPPTPPTQQIRELQNITLDSAKAAQHNKMLHLTNCYVLQYNGAVIQSKSI